MNFKILKTGARQTDLCDRQTDRSDVSPKNHRKNRISSFDQSIHSFERAIQVYIVLQEGIRNQQQCTQPDLKMDDNRIKEIGRRARERLELEKSKRKEIIRLDAHVPLDETTRKTAAGGAGSLPVETRMRLKGSTKSSFSMAVRQNSRKTGGKAHYKLKQQSHKKRTPKRKRETASSRRKNHSDVDDTNTDTWAPNTEGLLFYDLPRAEKANIVRLHGLPIGCRAENIRKFFGGLSPERIFVLPPLDVPMPGFDIDEDKYPRQKKSTSRSKRPPLDAPRVTRHSPTLRIYVKFPHSATAESSIARSGELVQVVKRDDIDGSLHNDKVKTISAAISVSPVSERVGKYLQKHMAIQCPKGKDFLDVLENAVKDIPKVVSNVINEILWVKAAQTLDLDLNLEFFGSGQFPVIRTKDILNISRFDLSNETRRTSIVRHHNNLLDLYESLENECSPLRFKEFIMDPCFSSVAHSLPDHNYAYLMNEAAQWLLDQMIKFQKAMLIVGEDK